MVGMSALSSTALFVTLSLHEMPRMRLKHCSAYMETAESPLLPGVQGPLFAAVQKGCSPCTQALYTSICPYAL